MATGLFIGAISLTCFLVALAVFAIATQIKQNRMAIMAKAIMLGMELEEQEDDAREFGCAYKVVLDDGSIIMSNSQVGLAHAFLKSKGVSL